MNIMTSRMGRILLGLGVGVAVVCQAADTGGSGGTFDQRLSAPQKFVPPAAGSQAEGTFEKQFETDTGETALTRRAGIDRTIPLGGVLATNRLRFKFDLSAWPADLRPLARMWVAVGAASAISNDGTLGLNFSQAGIGMSTELNNTYTVDGTMILGCDYAVKDGEVTLEVVNRTHLTDSRCMIHAIVYVPRKLDPQYPVGETLTVLFRVPIA